MYSRGGCIGAQCLATVKKYYAAVANLFPLCGGKASKEAGMDKFIAALGGDPQYQYHICLQNTQTKFQNILQMAEYSQRPLLILGFPVLFG